MKEVAHENCEMADREGGEYCVMNFQEVFGGSEDVAPTVIRDEEMEMVEVDAMWAVELQMGVMIHEVGSLGDAMRSID